MDTEYARSRNACGGTTGYRVLVLRYSQPRARRTAMSASPTFCHAGIPVRSSMKNAVATSIAAPSRRWDAPSMRRSREPASSGRNSRTDTR
jgi:hypothetical protein